MAETAASHITVCAKCATPVQSLGDVLRPCGHPPVLAIIPNPKAKAA